MKDGYHPHQLGAHFIASLLGDRAADEEIELVLTRIIETAASLGSNEPRKADVVESEQETGQEEEISTKELDDEPQVQASSLFGEEERMEAMEATQRKNMNE